MFVHVDVFSCTVHFCFILHFQEDSSSKRTIHNQLYEFEYDHVFHPECSQEVVFSEVSQLVQSALDGYNVCIFAYGQVSLQERITLYIYMYVYRRVRCAEQHVRFVLCISLEVSWSQSNMHTCI